MADCSKTEVFLAEWGRFCEETKCINCVFDSNCVNADFVISKAKKIVQKWSDEHPVPKQKTYADDFFEKYPMAQKNKSGEPMFCRELIFGKRSTHEMCVKDCGCEDCWNEPYEES